MPGRAKADGGCRPERLQALLDGELSPREADDATRHVERCWACRAELDELQGVALRFARSARDADYLGPERRRAAESRLLEALARERRQIASPRFAPVAAAPGRRAWAAALVVAAAASALAAGIAQNRPPARPEAVLARAAAAERSALASTAAEQSFRVDAVSAAGAAYPLGRLEMWEDGGRFAARWSGAGGQLRYALWQPRADARFALVAGRTLEKVAAAGAPQALDFPTLRGSDPAAIEAAFLDWLRSREWRLIRSAAELARFASEEGAILEARRTVEAGRASIELACERTLDAESLRMTLLLDAETGRPRLHAVRYRRGRRAAELRFVLERQRSLPPGSIGAAVFAPPPALARSEPAPPRPSAPPPGVLEPAPRTFFSLEALEIQAYAVLHRADACRLDDVEVTRGPDGALLIRGFAADAKRAAALELALAPLRAHPDVRVELHAYGDSAPAADPSAAGPMAVRRANAAVRHAEAILLEAHAARTLAGLPPPADPAAARSWREMLAEHVAALAEREVALRETLGLDPAAPTPEAPDRRPEDVRSAGLALLESARRLDARVGEAFASGRLAPTDSPEYAAQLEKLAAALADCARSRRRMNAAIAEFFSPHSL